jgi:hypothetical protein
MSSPTPGQEFGKIENSLCTFKQYGPEADNGENPQKSEIWITLKAGLHQDDPAL